MGISDMITEGLGKAKAAIGNLIGNEKLENEGKAEQLKSQAADAIDNVKDSVEAKADEVVAEIKDATDGK